MSEPASMALGALSLCGLFNTCVDTFQYIQLGRQFGQDFQTAQLGFQALQLRLSRWGKCVDVYGLEKVASTDLERRAVDHAKRTLQHVVDLIQKLRRLDGKLDSHIHSRDGRNVDDVAESLSTSIASLIAKRRGGSKTVVLAKWALYNKQEYETLVANIRDLLDDLEKNLPCPASPRNTLLIQEEIEEIRNDAGSQQQEETITLLRKASKLNDPALWAQISASDAKEENTILSITAEQTVDVRNGDLVTKAWAGIQNLPKSAAKSTIGSIAARGDANITNGNIYVEDERLFLRR